MPRSAARRATRAAVCRLAQPGSTTTSIRSTPSAVPRPRCSMPASMSTTTSWSRLEHEVAQHLAQQHVLRAGAAAPSALDGAHHQQPDAVDHDSELLGDVVDPRVHAQEAAPALAAADALVDERLQLRERRDAPGRDSRGCRRGSRRDRRPPPTTSRPRARRARASEAATVVLPTPPLPVTATFTRSPPAAAQGPRPRARRRCCGSSSSSERPARSCSATAGRAGP